LDKEVKKYILCYPKDRYLSHWYYKKN
jgi:hypothetical protein